VIVTIDGPAGAGKSSVAKRLAEEVGFDFLDTGAMYRCITLACLLKKVSLENELAIAEIAKSARIELHGGTVKLDGKEVSEEIRTPTVTKSIRPIADNTVVRLTMVALQRDWATGRNVVTEGRDQGTVAFPKAECKLFLTATAEERAHRRVRQLIQLGIDADYLEILDLQNERDACDIARTDGGLKVADDSITIWTDGLTEEEVLLTLVKIVQGIQSRG